MKALLTDLYELNMVASYLRRGMTGLATFSLFVRRLPEQRGFPVSAGLEGCLDYLEQLRFGDDDLEYLGTELEFPHQDLDWRLWSAAAWRARSAVRSQEKALRGVTCWDAGGEAAFGSREWRRPVPGEQWYVMPRQP